MSESQPDSPTLEQLLAALAERPLSETEQRRLNSLIQEDEAQLTQLVANLEMDALLQWHFGRVPPSAVPSVVTPEPIPSHAARTSPAPGSSWRNANRVAVVAATVALLVIGLALLLPHDPEETSAPDRGVRLTSGWLVRPTGAAMYDIVDPQHLRLDRGELLVQSDSDGASPSEPLWIETTSATAQADGTEFYIGAHQPSDSGGAIMSQITRVLVLAGTVTLANSAGEVQGQAGDLLRAKEDAAPEKLAVEANNAFAWRLYGELVREAPDDNLFFSPYSVATALAMAQEGARGQTALEMGEVLGFPDAARRVGDDAQLIPWRTALLQTGMAQLQERLNAREDEATRELRARITRLRAELEIVNARTTELDRQDKFEAAFESQREAQQLAREINGLLTQVDQYQLSVANAIWGDQSFPFDDEYVATINETFRTGGVYSVDFINDHDAAREEINAWTSEQTGGMIPRLLDDGTVNELTRLVLTNAVYFLGEWSEPFDERGTRPQVFERADGESFEIPFMNDRQTRSRYGAINADGSWFATPRRVRADGADADERYPGDDGFQILEMPYKGGELSMVFIVPRAADGLRRLHELLNSEHLRMWLGESERRSVRVRIPKFDTESEFSLVEPLRQLGMQRAFVAKLLPEGADFSGMTASPELQHQLCIADVIHQARISVSERGTEAVAATAIVAEPAAEAPPVELVPFTPQFRADRPFVYLIRDRESGAILFLGTMLDPTK